jgi:hypothetical protein
MDSLEAAIGRLSRSVELRQKGWKPRGNFAAAAKASIAPPAQVLCEAASGELATKSCAVGGMTARPVAISKRDPFTFSAWLNPAPADQDVALLSGLDYSQNTAAATYGSGIELRLVGGELEFRFSQRFPAYSVRVRSEGAGLIAGQWRHVALVYKGTSEKSEMRVHAAWIQMFVDGKEVATQVLNDDLTLPDAASNKPAQTTFRIGWDNGPKSPKFQGQPGEISFWSTALKPAEIAGIFETRALPFAVARQREHQASAAELGWLREAGLKASNKAFAGEFAELQRLRAELLVIRRNAPTVMVMQEMSAPRETHVLLRGAYDVPGEKVDAGVPQELLGEWPAGAPKNRLGLAKWLTKPDHPLTSRVVVNRFWQQLFGQGLVKTSDNFGLQGEWPSHPELLDWMAREFIDSRWNVKALMKQMVLSSTYRQDSAGSPDLIARDPENRLLARGPRFRLPAEVIRDQALEIAGLLKPRIGGPSVYPYQPADLYKGIVVAATYPGTSWVESKGDDLYRRSLYTFWKRTVLHPAMNVFDAPDREVCIVRRSNTNTPLQALTLLNDPIFVEAARKLAERSIREGGVNPQTRLAFAFRLATGRAPDERELRVLRTSLDQMLRDYQADEKGAQSLLAVGASASDAPIPAFELAAYTAVTNIILNMDEVITKG